MISTPQYNRHINRGQSPTHCYLCGRPLSKPTSKEHCPPLALFACKLRQQYNLNRLITHPVHMACNFSYQHDEAYFKATLVPFAPGSVAGDAIYKEAVAGFRTKKQKRVLAEKILREFEPRPSGLDLPSGLVVKRQEGSRIKRVAWKIVRGLYFNHHRAILPEAINVGCTVTAPRQPPPDHFQCVIGLGDNEKHGLYPGAFDYLFRSFETDHGNRNYWAFIIWDRIIVTVYFHDPWSCQCEDCISAVAEMEKRAGSSAIGQ